MEEVGHEHIGQAVCVGTLGRVEQDDKAIDAIKPPDVVFEDINIRETRQLGNKTLTKSCSFQHGIAKQIAQHLGEVGLTGTIESAQPYTRLHLARHIFIAEIREVLSKTLCQDETIEFGNDFTVALCMKVDNALYFIIEIDGKNIFNLIHIVSCYLMTIQR